jgi:hypothetical protein
MVLIYFITIRRNNEVKQLNLSKIINYLLKSFKKIFLD